MLWRKNGVILQKVDFVEMLSIFLITDDFNLKLLLNLHPWLSSDDNFNLNVTSFRIYGRRKLDEILPISNQIESSQVNCADLLI